LMYLRAEQPSLVQITVVFQIVPQLLVPVLTTDVFQILSTQMGT